MSVVSKPPTNFFSSVDCVLFKKEVQNLLAHLSLLVIIVELAFIFVAVTPPKDAPSMLNVFNPISFILIAFRPNKLSLLHKRV